MQLTELTLPTVADNLALDEALLLLAAQRAAAGEVLRLWELPTHVVVVGRGSKIEREVDWQACAAAGVDILRRCSGGAAVVLGPGCLVYSLILSYRLRPALRMLDQAHAFVLEKIIQGVAHAQATVGQAGISDLVVSRGQLSSPCKVSGNSVRCRRDHFLYHGTLLCEFDVTRLSQLLRLPPRQPEYRDGRSHADFVTNLGLPVQQLRRGLSAAWRLEPEDVQIPTELVEQLVRDKYASPEWNLAGRTTRASPDYS